MRKGIILISNLEADLVTILQQNRQNEFAYVDFVIATSDKALLNDIYDLHLGCYIYYVSNFLAVRNLIKKQRIDLVVFEGYQADDLTINDRISLSKNGISRHLEPDEKFGFYGQGKVKNLQIFHSEFQF
ncbi:MAG: hypothetical protein PHE89_07930 [Alphaproteobacteria bacterium]|nr:hypothetical protein [Alphaproteobacteria bacterium]